MTWPSKPMKWAGPFFCSWVKKDQTTGKIKGERFARRIVEGAEGEIIKDHWDNKGKATARLQQ